MSPQSLVAFRWAISQASRHEDCTPHVLMAIEPAFYGLVPEAGGMLPAATTDIEEHVLANLESWVGETAGPAGVEAESSLGIGPPARVLLEASRGADLLVVGSRGRGGFATLVLGSVSSQCANHAAVPTVVVPIDAPTGRSRRIVVGVDGSANASAALRWACEFAEAESSIVAVGAWTPPYLPADQRGSLDPTPREIAKAGFLDRVNEVTAEFGGREVESRFVTGDARTTITNPDLKADLLVVGARGHGGLSHALIGSVATWVLHHTKCATVVVPARG